MTKIIPAFAAALFAIALASPAMAADAAAPAKGPNADMMAKRQALHAEMQALHTEGTQIQDAIDALLDKCIAPEASAVEGCKKDKQALIERRAEHKKKIEALREKMMTDMPKMGPRGGMPPATAPAETK